MKKKYSDYQVVETGSSRCTRTIKPTHTAGRKEQAEEEKENEDGEGSCKKIKVLFLLARPYFLGDFLWGFF